MLIKLVDKLGTALHTPEEVVIQQDDELDEENTEMYYVSKGECIVNVVDETGAEHEGIRVLQKGQHFGEIAVIFKCHRSASVMCRNYNTLAKLRFRRYIELVAEYPEYEECLKTHVRETYKDHKIRFLLEMISRVEYLAGSTPEILYDIIFSL